jgi:hypothetical protein
MCCTKQKKIFCDVKKKHLTSGRGHAIILEVQGKNLDTEEDFDERMGTGNTV